MKNAILAACVAVLALSLLACDDSGDGAALAEGAEALCRAGGGIELSEGTWTNGEVREYLEDVLDEIRGVDAPAELREYQSARVRSIEVVIEALDRLDGDATSWTTMDIPAAFGDAFEGVTAELSEEAAAALEAAGCGLTP
ncbi:MAG: hypothetical protein F4X25_13840 [Chloroflexi bacterium]|nr:hypothetical protein [Chloroflexota bacterium]